MFWTIGLTESFINSLKLDDHDSIRNLHEILQKVVKSPNLIFADDNELKCLEKLRSLFLKSKIVPEYQIDANSLLTEIFSSIKIEKGSYKKKKCVLVDKENNDDFEFVEFLCNNNITDGVIIDENDDYFLDLQKKNFEIIKNKKLTGINFSELIKNFNNHSSGIPKRDLNNISEIKKIILDTSEFNLVLFNFLNVVHNLHNNTKENFSITNQLFGSIMFLANLIADNEICFNKKDKTQFNIITPMPDDSRLKGLTVDDFKKQVLDIFGYEDSVVLNTRNKFIKTGNSLNIYIVNRSQKSKDYKRLHSRGINTDYCSISTETDALCYFNGRKVTSLNKDMVFHYKPDWRMSEIKNVIQNQEISTKIKVF